MKKKLFGYVCVSLITIAFVFGVFTLFFKESKELEDISYHADNYVYSYEELKEYSQIIALIEVMDNLNKKNSEELVSQGYTVGCIARRQVKVLKYFKGERNYGNILTILEPASIIKNQYIHPEDYEKLEKGSKHLVFLSDDTATGELSLMSAYNRTFDIDNLNDIDEYYDLAIKSVVEYMTDLPVEQKDEVISADEIIKSNNVKNADVQTEILGAEHDMALYLEINADGKIAVQIIE